MSQDPPVEGELNEVRSAITDLEKLILLLSGTLQEELADRRRSSFMLAAKDGYTISSARRIELGQLAKRDYAQRSQRQKWLGSDILGEPAWDLLLDLYIADAEGRRISVSSACIASRVPTSTALRWIRLLEDRRLIERQTDQADGRRNWVHLSDEGRRKMDCLLEERLAWASRDKA